jgi:hypothetical protein
VELFLTSALQSITRSRLVRVVCVCLCAWLCSSQALATEDAYREKLLVEIRSSLSDKNKELAEQLVDIRIEEERKQGKATVFQENTKNQITHISADSEETKLQDSLSPIEIKNKIFGIRYWYATNKTKFKYYSPYTSYYGNPAAIIDWDGIKTHQIELFAKNNIVNEIFAKGAVGFKVAQKSGSMRDIDFLVNQVSYVDTTSTASNNRNNHASIDVGSDFKFDKLRLSPFIGFYYQRNRVDAYGGTLNSVDNSTLYNSLGWTPGMSNSAEYITLTYETIVKSPRIGVSGKYDFNKNNSFDYELAYYHRPKILLNDTHYSNSSKVDNGNPNGVSTGYGTGYGAEVIYNHLVAENTKFGVGLRYLQFRLTNKDMFFNTTASGWVNSVLGLKDLTLKQYGLLLNMEFKY